MKIYETSLGQMLCLRENGKPMGTGQLSYCWDNIANNYVYRRGFIWLVAPEGLANGQLPARQRYYDAGWGGIKLFTSPQPVSRTQEKNSSERCTFSGMRTMTRFWLGSTNSTFRYAIQWINSLMWMACEFYDPISSSRSLNSVKVILKINWHDAILKTGKMSKCYIIICRESSVVSFRYTITPKLKMSLYT